MAGDEVAALASRFLRQINSEDEEAMKKAPAFPVGLDLCDAELITALSTQLMRAQWRASYLHWRRGR